MIYPTFIGGRGFIRNCATDWLMVNAQRQLGVDVSMVLDQCLPWESDYDQTRAGLARTHAWAQRSLDAATPKKGHALFAITQGGRFDDLRLHSAKTLTKNDAFDGYAIGGLSVGESKDEMTHMLKLVAPHLPHNKPRYLMGVGRPLDMLDAVAHGIDMFDCVLPSRCGRTGKAFTHDGELNLHNACHRLADAPLDAHCPCHVCAHHTRAYLHHLFKTKEMLGATLLTWHNIAFYHHFMGLIRSSIVKNEFPQFRKAWRKRLTLNNLEP